MRTRKQDIAPAPFARTIQYNIAGPTSALGYQSPTLAQLMSRQAILDPIITKPSSAKRKTSSLPASSAPKKKRTTNRRIIQARTQQTVAITDSADAPSTGQISMDQVLESPSSQHDSAPTSPFPQLEAAPSPSNSPTSSQYDLHGPSTESERLPSPTQEISNIEKPAPSLSYSFAVDDFNVEQGEEISSSQVPSEKIQAKLKDILSLLNREIQDQVKDADLLRDALESIDQDLPADIRASLDPVSKLDNHFAAVKQALKNQSIQSDLEQKRAMAKQSVKNLHLQVQSNKKLLTGLQTALESKENRRAELEAELKNLSAEIEADKKKIAELPSLTEEMCKEGSAALNEDKQIKAKLSALTKIQEADKKLLENISGMVSNAKDVILKFLNV